MCLKMAMELTNDSAWGDAAAVEPRLQVQPRNKLRLVGRSKLSETCDHSKNRPINFAYATSKSEVNRAINLRD